MPIFSSKSEARLMTCHPDLQRLMREVIKHVDCSVMCGFRSEAEQEHCYEIGTSKLQWPHSKHNSQPALACDVMPYPVDWDNTSRVREFAAVVHECAARLGINVKWGGDWGWDLDHWQLAE